MRTVSASFLVIAATLFMAGQAKADCGPTESCIISFSVSPGAISGDNVQLATAQATAHVGINSYNQWELWINQLQGLVFRGCDPPATNFQSGWGCYVTGPNVSFTLSGGNNGSQDVQGYIQVQAYGQMDLGKDAYITVHPRLPQVPPDQQTDGPCNGDCGFGGKPINFTTGDTWITQRDYSIPGLGGGLSLTRTWNSLWPLAQPVETSGIFGHSWRSNFEERIQVLQGGLVKYWKGDGGKFFYQYDNLSGTYSLTAPVDEHTGLTFDSGSGQWTVTFRDGSRKIFNNAGYLISIVDRNGNTTSINVDAANQNRIATVTDAAGRVLTFHYDNPQFPRLCTSISDSVGTAATYTYDSSGRLSRVTYPDGSQFNFNYNSSNLILTVTDSQSKTIESHTYDSQRRGLTAQEANGVNKVSVTYWNTSTTITDSRTFNSTIGYTTVAQRNYSFMSSGGGCATCGYRFPVLKYFQGPYVVRSQDPSAKRPTLYTYDAQGNVASVSTPYGDIPTLTANGWHTWNYTYNSFGEVLTATDPQGPAGDPNHTTAYSYDANGNLLSVTTPSPDGGGTPGGVTSFTYNPNGTLATTTDPLNHATTLTYYPTGLINTITDNNNQQTTYAYDARGNLTSIQDPENGADKPTTFTYDAMNRLTSITYPGATSSVQFHYDWRGRRDWVQDQNGKRTTYAYDDADRLVSVTDSQSPTPGITTYAYDTENDLTDIWDAKGNHTHFDYSGQSALLSQMTFPSGLTETYTWEANQPNLKSKKDRNLNTINYLFDFENRLYRKAYPGGATAQFTYDAGGRLAQATDASGTYSFTYDNMNRLTQALADYSFDTAGAYSLRYSYDAASNRTQMVDPQEGTTHYGYDALNRLVSLTDPQSNQFTFGYDGLSRRTSLNRPNGVNTAYSYDAVSRLQSVLHQLNGVTLDGASYTYDNAGNRTSKTDLLAGVTSSYSYDGIYQLTGVTQNGTTTESYTYDLVGNRLSSLGMSPYSYNSSNELTSTPTATYTYDNNGNTKTKVDASGTTTYNWDYENRLTSVVLPGTGGTVSFRYDPFGRRVQKSGAGGITNYLYDGDNLLEEVDNSGNVLAKYTVTRSPDEQLSELRSGITRGHLINSSSSG